MSSTQLIALTGDALWLALLSAAPALLAAVAVGFLMGLLQSATQIQDAAIGFVPKLAAVAVALVMSGSVLRERLIAFAREVLQACG